MVPLKIREIQKYLSLCFYQNQGNSWYFRQPKCQPFKRSLKPEFNIKPPLLSIPRSNLAQQKSLIWRILHVHDNFHLFEKTFYLIIDAGDINHFYPTFHEPLDEIIHVPVFHLSVLYRNDFIIFCRDGWYFNRLFPGILIEVAKLIILKKQSCFHYFILLVCILFITKITPHYTREGL